MKLSVKFLRTNEHTHNDEEVLEGTKYGFWRVVEHTEAGWFPWSDIFDTCEAAEKLIERVS